MTKEPEWLFPLGLPLEHEVLDEVLSIVDVMPKVGNPSPVNVRTPPMWEGERGGAISYIGGRYMRGRERSER